LLQVADFALFIEMAYPLLSFLSRRREHGSESVKDKIGEDYEIAKLRDRTGNPKRHGDAHRQFITTD